MVLDGLTEYLPTSEFRPSHLARALLPGDDPQWNHLRVLQKNLKLLGNPALPAQMAKLLVAHFILTFFLFISFLPLFASGASYRQSQIIVRSELVQIDVSVTGKNGKPLVGLSLNNFQLFEDGQLQKLIAVDFFDVSQSSRSPTSETIEVSLLTANDPAALNAIGNDHRLIVLFFDKTSMKPEDLLRSVNAAKKFVKEQMTPADLVAVAAFDTELRIASPFTNVPRDIAAGLSSVIASYQASANPDNPIRPSGYLANTGQRLAAAGAVAQLLAQIPGRKSIIHFTGGLVSPGDRNGADVAAATDKANDSNSSFYEVDARALLTLQPTPRSLFPNPDASRNVLNALAEDTGGKLFIDTNDFADIFRQVQELSTKYYMLSYISTNKQHDGRFRKTLVKMVDVPGGHATFRQGYVAPRN
jgi:VWFA-related protein